MWSSRAGAGERGAGAGCGSGRCTSTRSMCRWTSPWAGTSTGSSPTVGLSDRRWTSPRVLREGTATRRPASWRDRAPSAARAGARWARSSSRLTVRTPVERSALDSVRTSAMGSVPTPVVGRVVGSAVGPVPWAGAGPGRPGSVRSGSGPRAPSGGRRLGAAAAGTVTGTDGAASCRGAGTRRDGGGWCAAGGVARAGRLGSVGPEVPGAVAGRGSSRPGSPGTAGGAGSAPAPAPAPEDWDTAARGASVPAAGRWRTVSVDRESWVGSRCCTSPRSAAGVASGASTARGPAGASKRPLRRTVSAGPAEARPTSRSKTLIGTAPRGGPAPGRRRGGRRAGRAPRARTTRRRRRARRPRRSPGWRRRRRGP